MKIHPQTIVAGWRKAVRVAVNALQEHVVDNSNDLKSFRKDLINIARTTLCSKIVSTEIELFAELCVEAVLRLKGQSIEMIHIIKKKKIIKNPKILIANTPMDTDKIKIFGARVRVSSINKISEIEKAEKEKMKIKVEKILRHKIEPVYQSPINLQLSRSNFFRGKCEYY